MEVFPEDWTRKSYTDLFRHYSVREHQIPMSQILSHGDIPVVDQGQDEIAGYTNDAERVMQIPAEGVIVFGDHTRIIKLVKFPFCIGADGVQVLACKEDDADFVVQLMSCMEIPNLGYSRHFKYIKAATYFLPPLPEQRRIAAALGDMDKLIDNLSKRIEKKKAIKQGAMQELLTGKKRLPGFEGEWEMVKFKDIVPSITTGLNPRANFMLNNGGVNYYVTIKDFFDGILDFTSCARIDDYALRMIQERSCLKKGDILFSSIGRVGDAYVIRDEPKNWNINESVFALHLARNVDSDFLYFKIKSTEFRSQMEGASTGSTMNGIKLGHLKRLDVHLPVSIAEQRAIAKVLGDMDEEIAKLEAKREKLTGIKKGMMSDLLTGKVRLKTEME